jgi:hypothetical protein
MRKTANEKELLEVIRAALDCRTHFHSPTIVENDPDFKIGDKAIVICGQCVDRMREAIGLRPGEECPPHFEYF